MMGNMSRFHIRSARPDEAGLFYTPHPEEDKRRGTIGHIRMDFGRSGNEFWHTWWPRGPEELNSPVFKAELQEVVDTLRAVSYTHLDVYKRQMFYLLVVFAAVSSSISLLEDLGS